MYLSKNIIIILLLIAITTISGCKQINKRSESMSPIFYKINISKDIDSPKDIKLSTISDNINYIPLETLPSSYLKDINSIKVRKSGIYICDGNVVLKFSESGKFMKQIGSIGNGPGEYINPTLLAANEETNTVWIQSENGKLLRYDLNGKKLDEKIVLHGMYNLVFCNNKIFFYQNVSSKNQQKKCNLIIADTNLNELQRFCSLQDNVGTFSFAVGLYYFNNKVFCKGVFNDTIFQITNLGLQPHGIIELGEFQLPQVFSLTDILSQKTNVADKYFVHSNIFETDLFLFAELSTLRAIDKVRQKRYLYYDKIKAKHFVLPQTGFVNDINGGLPFVPEYYNNDNICINCIDACKFKDWVNSEQFKNSTLKYPEMKIVLEKLANSLNDNDNPVLMLVKLKE